MLNIPLMSNNIIKDDIDALIQFLKNTDRFTNGPKVKEFEEEWSKWLGVKYSVFVNSGSSANMLTMAAIHELYGDGEVIVPAITWVSDITSIINAGLKPTIVDVDLKNLALSYDKVVDKINKNTRAVFLSHILGFNGLSEKLYDICNDNDILLIEDACESHGATACIHGKRAKCGSFGFASNFSFYYAHHMSTIEGGMICTNDEKFYEYIRLFRSHGMLRESADENFKSEGQKLYSNVHPEFIFVVPGYNMRSTELNAVIGLNQLKRLDENIEKRKYNFNVFINNLDSQKYYTDFICEGNSNYAFVILQRMPDKEKFINLINMLRSESVEFRRGTAGGGNQVRQPYLRKRFSHINPSDYTNAEMIHDFGLYTGNYPDLEKEKILKLCDLLNSI